MRSQAEFNNEPAGSNSKEDKMKNLSDIGYIIAAGAISLSMPAMALLSLIG